ncbi:MAG: endonuclease III [Calditrichaeota bacterium]|nr:MAG: endonuclease III [Calditrichota bacterium]
MSDDLRKLLLQVVDRLEKTYPDAHLELNYSNPFELLIATILAAQCTDAKVNQVTETLFKKYPDPAAFLAVDLAQLQEDIRALTFYRNKAKYIRACCELLVEKHGGKVPDRVEDLVKCPGVGRKTANIVLANAMGIPAIGVDTHTIRVPNRLGVVASKDPDEIERVLCDLLPRERWNRANILIQWHGRYTCTAKQPRCGECTVFDLCRWPDKESFS